MKIELVDAYETGHGYSAERLYGMLLEREPVSSISHRALPEYSAHRAFFESRPYAAWYLVFEDENADVVGQAYITKGHSGHLDISEVGIQVIKSYQRRGIGQQIIDALIKRHGTPLYANIAPGNEGSARFFERQGFTHIQNTYRLGHENNS